MQRKASPEKRRFGIRNPILYESAMSAPPTDLQDPPSPCIDVCTMDKDAGLCPGCLRTIDEIAGWRRFTPTEKLAVLDKLGPRRAALERAPG